MTYNNLNDDIDNQYHYSNEGIDHSEIFSIVIGVISSLFPLSVVFIMLYRYEILLKSKAFSHYILMIAISDTIVSISIAMGFPKNGTSACYTQGLLNFFFSRASWFFTDILIVQVHINTNTNTTLILILI